MPTFPTLKTGAFAQYPVTVKTVFVATKAVEFLDGSSQRYSCGAPPLRQWIVRLDKLDPREEAAIAAFVHSNSEGTFSFVDPFSGVTVPRCALRGLMVQSDMIGELNKQNSFVIEELL